MFTNAYSSYQQGHVLNSYSKLSICEVSSCTCLLTQAVKHTWAAQDTYPVLQHRTLTRYCSRGHLPGTAAQDTYPVGPTAAEDTSSDLKLHRTTTSGLSTAGQDT